MAQNYDFEQHLYNSYERYKENSLTHRRFKHADIVPLIKNLKSKHGFKVTKAGKSVEGRDLNLISIGNGETKIFLWSQMHGDEPTATAALFDIFNFFSDSANYDFNKRLFSKVKLYFLPMVNPDGAERFKRRNYYDVDLNRDASRLQCPEAIILKNVFDSLKADFGFNLHDQSPRYSVGNTFKAAALSFLAPAFNYEKQVNDVREKSIKLIGNLYMMLSEFIPGHIAKYSDEFEPRAFGDNFQKWGTSTVLIESGGWKNDPEKQFLRKLNFITILSAIKSIAEKSYETTETNIYESIPFNEKYIYDVVLRNLTVVNGKHKIKLDVAFNKNEIESKDGKAFYYKSEVTDLGDLSTYFGYDDFDFDGYEIERASVYSKKVFQINKIDTINFFNLHSKGISTILVNKLPDENFINFPINLALKNRIDTTINIGESANFVIKKGGKVEYVIINGFLHRVEKNRLFEGNGLVIK